MAETSKQAEILGQQALDAKNEVHVLKRKHAASIRELTRELQIAHSAKSSRHEKPVLNHGVENNNHHPSTTPVADATGRHSPGKFLLSFGNSGIIAITKGFSNTNVYFLILGKSHSNTSSNSSLNRLESPSNDLVRSENSVYVDDKSQMRSNHLLDSPQSTSSSQSNLSHNEYNFTQVFYSYFNTRRIMRKYRP